jgi:hypothetical protein
MKKIKQVKREGQKFVWSFVIVCFLLSGAVLLNMTSGQSKFFNNSRSYSAVNLNERNKPLMPKVSNEIYCNNDSDCVLVPKGNAKNPCCSSCSNEVVNNQTKQQRISWWAKNCSQAICPIFDCLPEILGNPRCINNECKLIKSTQ